jgi:ATP-binding cassette subfamily C protein CydD
LRWLLSQARPAGPWLALAAGLGLAGGFLTVAQAALLARIFQQAAVDGAPLKSLLPMFLLCLAVILLRAGAGWGREEAGFAAGAKVRARIRSAMLERLFDLGPAVFAGCRSGDTAATVLERVEALQAFYARYLPQLAVAAAVPCTVLAAIFPISWAAGGLLLFTAPLIPFFMVLVGMGAEAVSQRHFDALGKLGAQFLDILQGIETLKRFGRSRERAESIARSSESYRRRTMAVLRIAFLSSAVLEFFASISIALVAVYLGLSYLGYLDFGLYGRALTLQSGLFILLLAPEFYLPLRELGAHYHARAEAVGAAGEIERVMAQAPRPVPGTATENAAAARIRFEKVCFSYAPEQTPVLQDVELSLCRGRRTVLMGPSGEGKTTLLFLLLQFLAPTGGRILVDGRPLSEMAPDTWRRQVGWVGQEPVLLSGTVRENIRLARPEATDAQIEAAAKMAHVSEFLPRLPGGIDGQVGEGGRLLSRGQAQRVALARVFLKDAPVLLLDEPQAGLDAETEQAVTTALQTLCRNKTVLWVTHRLAAVDPADRVLVVSDGQVREAGPGDLLRGGMRNR